MCFCFGDERLGKNDVELRLKLANHGDGLRVMTDLGIGEKVLVHTEGDLRSYCKPEYS